MAMTWADILRNAIRNRATPIAVVARSANVPQPVLCRFMHGQQGLTLATAERLAGFLALTLTPIPKAPSQSIDPNNATPVQMIETTPTPRRPTTRSNSHERP